MMTARSIESGCSLAALLADLAAIGPGQERLIRGLATDSRQVQPGDLFLACAGQQTHGLQFLSQALAAGAVAVAWEPAAGIPVPTADVPLVAIPGLGRHLGLVADRFFGHPSRDLQVVGITGTDGKTSCSHFIAQALSVGGGACGLLGTLGYGVYGALAAGSHTTPDAVALQRELAQLRDGGVERVVMEVSSHGLDQGRVAGIAFDIAVFTNLSRDHLDYHGDLAAYGAAKRRLFQQAGLGWAVLNGDDPFGRELVQTLPAGTEAVLYGLDMGPMDDGRRYVRGRDLVLDRAGLSLAVESSWGQGRLQAGLLGRFNAGNLLAALAVLLVMEMPLDEALERLAATRTVAGRMEPFGGSASRPLVVVDYAHTPRALEQVLMALRPHCAGDLWCVFGAGGERDRGKRPLMGAAAEQLADHVVVTDDNPRGEDATQIVVDILAGMNDPDTCYVERDRGQALALAIGTAHPDDVVLVAGKGHETWQQIGTRRLPFSDRDEVVRLLGEERP